MPRELPAGLSFRAAGRRAGCSHVAIRKAVERGHLAQLADGSVSETAIDAWNKSRRAPRGGMSRAQAERRAVTFGRDAVTGSAVTVAPGAAADVPSEAVTLSAALECGAYGLALIACRTLPMAAARALVAEWVAAEIEGWIGGPSIPESHTPAWAWPAPPGASTWREHHLFARLAPPDGAWPEIAAEAAAWRAANGRDAG